MTNRRVTIKDVSRLAGVSIAAASRALNGKQDVAADKRARIIEAAERLGYVPNSLARGLAMGKTKTIGVIVTDNSSPVYARILRSIEQVANREGFGVLMANSADSQDQALRNLDMLLASQVSGVLLVPVQSDRRDLERLRASGTPFVLLLRRFADDLDSDFVITDNVKGGYLATRHLVELGHKRIGHIAGPALVSTAEERLEGYRRALAEGGLQLDPRLIVRTPYTIEGGEDSARRLFGLADPPTAIFAATDRQAVGALKAADELGLRVPRDVALVGGDDIELAEFLAVPLTTFHQRADDIGVRGMQMLLSRLEQEDDDDRTPEQVVLAPDLVIRASCGAQPAKGTKA
jgi:LacI family transcriptional regulator